MPARAVKQPPRRADAPVDPVRAADDEAKRSFHAQRLLRTLDETAARAQLSEEALEKLLADES